MIAEAGMTQEVADFHKQFLDIITLAKETGEKNTEQQLWLYLLLV